MDKVILKKISRKILFFIISTQFLAINGMLVQKQKTKYERQKEKPNMMSRLGQNDQDSQSPNFSFLTASRISPKQRILKKNIPIKLTPKTPKKTLKPACSIGGESNENLNFLDLDNLPKESFSLEQNGSFDGSFDSLFSLDKEEPLQKEKPEKKDSPKRLTNIPQEEKKLNKITEEPKSRPSSPQETLSPKKHDLIKMGAKIFASKKQLEISEFIEKQKLSGLTPEQPKSNRTKTKKERLKEINIDFKIAKEILSVEGLVFFCDTRNFTCFSNECENPSDPARFMSEITKLAEMLAYKWGSYVIGIAGDAHLVFFPKFKSEENYNKALKNCFLCAIEFVIKSIELMKKYSEKHYPKQCDLGIEAGTVCLYSLKNNAIIKFAATSKTINNAQRYEDDAKKGEGLNKRKITLTEQNFIQLKDLKELFGPKHLLNAKGIKGHPFVYSCPLEEIRAFYNSADWENHESEISRRNNEKKPRENFEKLLKLFKALNKNK